MSAPAAATLQGYSQTRSAKNIEAGLTSDRAQQYSSRLPVCNWGHCCIMAAWYPTPSVMAAGLLYWD